MRFFYTRSLTDVKLLSFLASLLMRKGNLVGLQIGRRNEPNGSYDLALFRFQLTRADRFVNGLAGDPELACGFGYREGFFGGHTFLGITALLIDSNRNRHGF
jgi:hypothetical protein